MIGEVPKDLYSHFSLLAVPRFFFPGHLYHGPRALSFLKVWEGDFLMVASRGAWEKHGAHVAAHLASAPEHIFWVEKEPDTEIVHDLAGRLDEREYRYVIGFGGGSVMDVAKAARICRKEVKVILIPTTAGSGSEVSRYALFINERKEKKPLVSSLLLPDTVLYDPSLLTSLPPEVTAYTSVDAYAHALEGLTSRLANLWSDAFAIRALELIREYAPRAYRQPEDFEARTFLQLAGFLGGLVQSSASVGLIHGLADFFGPRYGVEHGRAIAAFLLPVMRLNVRKGADYYKKLKKEAGGVITAARTFLGELGFIEGFAGNLFGGEVSLSDLSQFIQKDPAARTHPFAPTASDLEEILAAAGIRYGK